MALALVHHAACLLVIIEWHGRGRHRLDIDGDICFTVRNNYILEKGIAHLGALPCFTINSPMSFITRYLVIPGLSPGSPPNPKTKPLSCDPERAPISRPKLTRDPGPSPTP